jgi:hypothetical protein
MRLNILHVAVGAILALKIPSARLQRSSPRSRRGKSGFHGLYLAVEVVNIRMSENEVVARSFVITYRLTRDSQPKALEFNYMKNRSGCL